MDRCKGTFRPHLHIENKILIECWEYEYKEIASFVWRVEKYSVLAGVF